MTMNDPLLWALCFAAGAAVGAAYLALLWAAVRVFSRQQDGGRRGTGLFIGLTLLRGGLAVAAMGLGLYLKIGAAGLLAGLGGFVVVRFAVTRWIGTARQGTM